MKNNFGLKLFYILPMLIGIQFVHADKLSFHFVYTTGIESVLFDYTANKSSETAAKDHNLRVSTTNHGYYYIVDVDTKIKSGGVTTVANSFNKNVNFDPNHMIELTATMANPPTYLDFWVRGTLYINGELVASDFTLAHSPSSHDWWIATLAGSKYIPTQSMNVHTIDGKYYYCLNQDGSNYRIIVSPGMCNQNQLYPYDWSNASDMKVHFKYGSGVESIVFVYEGINDDIHKNHNYLQSVTEYDYKKGYEITVTSKILAENETAQSFVKKFKPTSPKYNMLKTGWSELSAPSKLNFWIEGKLYINGQLVVSDFTIAEQSGLADTWWVGSNEFHNPGLPMVSLGEYCFKATNSYTIMVYKGFCY